MKSHIHIIKLAYGGVIMSADTAIAVAGAVLKGHYGESALAEHGPLRATDLGEVWRVEGSFVDPDHPKGMGPWRIELRKDDGRVVWLGHVVELDVPDDVKPYIEEAKRPPKR